MSITIDYTSGFFSPNVSGDKLGDITESSDSYNLSVASYDGVSFSVAGQDGVPVGLFFKPDGLSLYVTGNLNKNVFQYSLSTAWDLSTASYASLSASIASQVSSARGLQFSSDGTKMFVLDSSTNDAVFQYSLSTAWDVSSASYDSVSLSVTFGSNGSFCMSYDGLKLYTIDEADDVDQYTLSTAWDLSTATFTATKGKLFASDETSPSGIFFSPTGDKVFICGYNSDVVAQGTLSTNFDITTAVSDSVTFSVSGQETTPYGVFFKSDGSKMYVIGITTDTIYQYSTGNGEQTTIDLSSGNYFELTPTQNANFVFNNPPASGYGCSFSLKITGGNTANVYDLANAVYDSKSFSVAGQTIITRGLFIKPDGTKMYVVDLQFDRVLEYDLSGAWDVSTASFLQNLSVQAEDTSPVDVFFKPDGIKMYVLGDSGNEVNEYDLSTAWNISTASFLQTFSVSAQEGGPQGLFFKPDGTKMYIIGVAGDDVNEYSLSSAWDISTASYVQNFSVAAQENSPTNISFKPDGTRMYVVGYTNDAVNEYSLSSAWDISTASYIQSFSVAAQQTQPQGIFFKDDGLKMYVSGDSPDSVFQYTTGTTTPATITYPDSVVWSNGTVPDAPVVGEKDMLTFYTIDGGNKYYGFKVGDSYS